MGEIRNRPDLIGNTLASRHGMTKKNQKPPRIYSIWRGIKMRCLVKKDPGFRYYGARGIKVCRRWMTFKNFYKDMGKSYEKHCKVHGERQTSIHRINNDGNYSPLNCKWSTWNEQNNNSRNCVIIKYKDLKLNVSQWAKKLGLKKITLHARLFRYGWTIEKALTMRVRHG